MRKLFENILTLKLVATQLDILEILEPQEYWPLDSELILQLWILCGNCVLDICKIICFVPGNLSRVTKRSNTAITS